MAEEKMTSKFPFSMESLPRQQNFACFSLKFGSIFSGLLVILYSVLAIAQCVAALGVLPNQLDIEDANSMVTYGLVIVITITYAVTLFLSALMLVGVLCDKSYLIRPWVVWESIKMTLSILMFVFWSTMSMINNFGDGSLVIYMVEFLILLIRFYMLMIVSSYFRQLEEERGETKRLVRLINSDSWYNV